MKKIILFSFATLAITQINAQKKPLKTNVVTTAIPSTKIVTASSPFKNGTDSLSYALGMSIGESLKQAGVTKINNQYLPKQ